MLLRSNIWKSLAVSGSAKFETVLIIDRQEYAPASAPKVSRAAMQSALTVGAAMTGTIQFSLRAASGIPDSGTAILQGRFRRGEVVSEWQTLGTFHVSTQQADPVGNTIEYQGFDSMQNAEKPFPVLFGFPKSMTSVVSEIAHEMGVEVDFGTWDIMETGLQYRVPLPADTDSMIKILSWIGGVQGGNFVITPHNKLRLVPVISSSGAASAEDKVDVAGILQKVSTGTALTVAGVRAYTGTRAMVAGDLTGGVLTVTADPYVDLGRRTASELLSRNQGKVYTPFTLERAIYDPALEMGDYITSRSDISGVIYQETAYYGAAFRGDLSAPPLQETAERSVSERSNSSAAAALDLSVHFYRFISQNAVSISDGGTETVIDFDYAAGAGQNVIFHAEIKHTISTTESLQNETYTENDAVLTVTYYINGAEVTTYHPVKRETDGENLLHLMYHFTNGEYPSGNFRADISVSGSAVSIAAGDAFAYIIGQGAVEGITDWIPEDGLVFVGVESYPDKLEYQTGEELDYTGLVVKAYYADGTEQDVTAQCTLTPAEGDTVESGVETVTVEIEYAEDGKTYRDSFDLWVVNNGIIFLDVTTPPDKTVYILDREGGD